MRVFDETWRLVTWTRMVSDEEMNPNKIQVPTKETTHLEKNLVKAIIAFLKGTTFSKHRVTPRLL